MHSEVSVTFKNLPPFRVDLHDQPAMAADDARTWLNTQFTQLECEPLRPTGKLLTADKVVVIAQAAGPERFAQAAWAQQFASAASAALGKPIVHVDASTLSISY